MPRLRQNEGLQGSHLASKIAPASPNTHPHTQCEQALDAFRSMGIDTQSFSVLEEKLKIKHQKELFTRPLHERTQEATRKIGEIEFQFKKKRHDIFYASKRIDELDAEIDLQGQLACGIAAQVARQECHV